MKLPLTIRELELCRRELLRQGWINRAQYDELGRTLKILREVKDCHEVTQCFGQTHLELGL